MNEKNSQIEMAKKLNNTGSSSGKKHHKSNMKSPSVSKKSPKSKHTSLKFDKSLDNTLTSQMNRSNEFDHDISEKSHIRYK